VSPRTGKLYLIGGKEDREHGKTVLSRLVAEAGGAGVNVALVTAASNIQPEVAQAYEETFSLLGAARCRAVAIDEREQADDMAHADAILHADLVFLTGGDQRRLMARIGGTRTELAIHRALHERGACIAGTSAGAAAMSGQMLSDASCDTPGQAPLVQLSRGLGLLPRLVVDQHFAQRRRLGRLWSAVAHDPSLLGVGIDEDTALLIEPGRAVEVVGDGEVMLVDRRGLPPDPMAAPCAPATEEAAGRLHRLRAGTCHRLDGTSPDGPADPKLLELVALVAAPLEPLPPVRDHVR
jgi:cyanophycinase